MLRGPLPADGPRLGSNNGVRPLRFHPPVVRARRSSRMQQLVTRLEISTRGPGLYEFTSDLRDFAGRSALRTGLLTAYCPHTSCSLLIQENADPDVKTDLMGFFRRLVPDGMDWIAHRTEGPDDMPAHIKTTLTQTSIGIPVVDGAPVLGTWQGIY